MIDVTQEELSRAIVEELGIGELSKEEQEEILTLFGENLVKKLTTEILTIVPKEKHDEYMRLTEEGKIVEVHELLKPHIPNFDAFIETEVSKELALTKERFAGST
ncbi:hypothetical protein COU17_02055 [Candidatus Kaiserbacteria bacterium CG10_big_fil_rev_8_21_14_0_10_49_17]|uniref:Uncharacterized protein n=1 Tax=Candidatus Kaiserbacteria bacterium CG10_big_fil_rev_8_21_14_0_10_49_17 TaxID=1974609 RepID=A0A2M6WE95_9BACT|nr:MAG: hypothetical protein COU17_02055 [Candidatus Kaiserbacteria bacterium CG10_big_fil_rev_8_21_14_0_10_49_17]